ncbi:MAG: ferrochelatase [Cyanobacteria bacterium REEB65]|nr:ferrochelatase [Cyanobacteria bacterium REEB65]
MPGKAIVLMQLGGPDAPESIAPFLENLFSDPYTIPLPFWLKPFQRPLARMVATRRAPKVAGLYEHMGGSSPILANTQAQAHALASELAGRGESVRVLVAMRAWHPLTEAAVDAIAAEDLDEVVLLPLYPQESSATSGSSVARFKEVAAQRRLRAMVRVASPYFDEPAYLQAIAETIREALPRFDDPGRVAILFSAHSLPLVIVRSGDPYPAQIAATHEAVEGQLGMAGQTHLAFQSQTGGVKWLGPTVHEVVENIQRQGARDVLMVPLGFVSDHLETLYEMDVLYRQLVEGRGMRFERAASLGDRPTFIRALANVAQRSF